MDVKDSKVFTDEREAGGIEVRKLLPCPFCGGIARISCDTEAVKDSQGRLWAFTVVCDHCCASSGLTYKPDKAIAAWNRRD